MALQSYASDRESSNDSDGARTPVPSSASGFYDEDDALSFEYFSTSMMREWKACTADPVKYRYPTPDKHLDVDKSWLHYAAVCNPRVAYELRRIADVVKELLGDYHSDKNLANYSITNCNAAVYLSSSLRVVAERWTRMLDPWHTENLARSPNLPKRSLELELFQSSRLEIQQRLRYLDEYTTRSSASSDFLEAARFRVEIRQMLPRLGSLQTALSSLNNAAALQGDTASADNVSILRRRRKDVPGRETKQVDEQDQLDTDVRVGETKTISLNATLQWLRPLYQWVLTSESLFHWVDKQSALWTSTIISIGISGILLGIAISSSRPVGCAPSFPTLASDDNFWTLLLQLVLQMFSLYCTAVPLVRDNNLLVTRRYFFCSIAISVITSSISPAVYVVSWKASTILSYVSNVAALCTSVQLAGGVQHLINSPQNRPRLGQP